MKFRRLAESKCHVQQKQHLRANQRFGARYHSSKVRGSEGRTLNGSKLEEEKELL